jgi:hypothetical protein
MGLVRKRVKRITHCHDVIEQPAPVTELGTGMHKIANEPLKGGDTIA